MNLLVSLLLLLSSLLFFVLRLSLLPPPPPPPPAVVPQHTAPRRGSLRQAVNQSLKEPTRKLAIGGMSSLLGLLGSAAFALVAVYLASLVTVCHGPCGNKKDDVLYEMRSAACCSPSVQDCGNFLPGQGSTWLHGIR